MPRGTPGAQHGRALDPRQSEVEHRDVIGFGFTEVYGNKFIITDASGRALVETGREGEGGRLVKPNETVTGQGRFERGFLHASVSQHEDGRADLVGRRTVRNRMGPSAGCATPSAAEPAEPIRLEHVGVPSAFGIHFQAAASGHPTCQDIITSRSRER